MIFQPGISSCTNPRITQSSQASSCFMFSKKWSLISLVTTDLSSCSTLKALIISITHLDLVVTVLRLLVWPTLSSTSSIKPALNSWSSPTNMLLLQSFPFEKMPHLPTQLLTQARKLDVILSLKLHSLFQSHIQTLFILFLKLLSILPTFLHFQWYHWMSIHNRLSLKPRQVF